MKNCVNKFQHQNTKNRTVILIFPIYRTYLFICCVIYLKVWWHCATCTVNWRVPWNEPWFRTARMVRRNNIKRKVRHMYSYWWHTQNHNYRSIEISHSHGRIETTKTVWWPQMKEVTIITVLSKKWPKSFNCFNKVWATINNHLVMS